MIANLLGMNPVIPGGFLLVVLIFIGAEYAYCKLVHHDNEHDGRETLASFAVGVGDILSRIATGAIAAIPFFFLYNHRLFDIPMDTAWSWVALFLGVEFAYYWFHRASHRVRWLWATHATHHSATHFNLSVAVRLGWTGQLTGAFIFFLPLAWLGFPPLAIAGTIAAGLLYQFFLHTAFDVYMGPLEWVLNTPAHHRVHHACNDACLDKNYGSVLIIFDRLLGTFAKTPSHEQLRFGLKGRSPSNNPFKIALGEWAMLWQDARAAKTLRGKLRIIIGPPR